MSIENKLRSIIDIKSQIKNAISEKGIIINDNTPFKDYPSKISSISSVDTDAPIIYSFDFIINNNRSVTFSGKTESGVSIILRNPSEKIIPITIDNNGDFIATTKAPAEQGVYTLIVVDPSGNISTETKQILLPEIVSDPIKSLYTAGIEGVYYDINDLSTVFQDVGGTIPVTEIGQTVGCVKDKSGNGCHLIQPTVSKQPKLTRDMVTGSYGLAWDGIDDSMYASIPNIVTTSLQIFFSQKYNDITKSNFNIYLSDTLMYPTFPAFIRNLFFISVYDEFFSKTVLRAYRNNTAISQMTGISTLRNVFGLKHVLNSPLYVYHNETKEYFHAQYQGTIWYPPSPNFIVLTNTNGVTYKFMLIGKELSISESRIVKNTMNIDVGAWT